MLVGGPHGSTERTTAETHAIVRSRPRPLCPPALTAADHKGIPLLAALDELLVAALRSGDINRSERRF